MAARRFKERAQRRAAVCGAIGLMCLALLWGGPGGAAALATPVSVNGITEPVDDVTLSSDVSAKIWRLPFKEGDFVKKGEVVVELEHSVESLEVKRRELIWKDKSELQAAEAKEQTLKTILAATKDLFESTKSVSKEELENKQLDYDLAVASHQKLEQSEAREKVEYEMAKASLAKRLIRAPIVWVIIETHFEEGESCQEQQPIIRLVDPRVCRFVGNVEEHIGRQLKKGQEVQLKIANGGTTVDRPGKISFVSPVVDPASGLLVVKAVFANRDGVVRPGVAAEMVSQEQ